ncbi:Bug family tripartite tricarboxylate transporter substrate binding protein [Actinophytocola sp.]|uniref:Bug family tripartite tricarboxylate transporter substrate binding protein n=1 Tax=Actinophytocola sp. TaxID=1872138 RepID=UPI003D6AFAD4
MRRRPSILLAITTLVLAGCGATGPGSDQQSADFPTEPIVFTLPNPGGTAEIVGRSLAESGIRPISPVDVRVNAVQGAGTNDAVGRMLAEPEADSGHRLAIITNATVVATAVGEAPFAFDQFRGVAALGSSPLALAVPSDSPWRSVDDFAAAARKDPAKIRVALPASVGSIHHLTIARLGDAVGATAAPFTVIPHPDAGSSMLTLLGGGADIAIGSLSGLTQYIESNDARVLASTSAERSPLAEDVPTLTELGYEIEIENMFMVVASSKVPDNRISVLSDLVHQGVDNKAFNDLFEGKLQWHAGYVDAEQTQEDMTDIYEQAQQFAKDLGLA